MRALVPYVSLELFDRDLVEMMAERGIILSHSTILRWVLRYVPEFEKRWGRYARRVHSSWRMDETSVSVRGGAHYLCASGTNSSGNSLVHPAKSM